MPAPSTAPTQAAQAAVARVARWPWAVAVVALGVAGVVMSVGWGGAHTATAISDVAGVVTALGGAGVLARTARRPDRPQVAWSWLAAAMASWGLGELLWTWDEVVRHRDVPFPALADVAFLAAVPCAVVGLLAFGRGTRVRMGTLLDGCLVASALLFVTWALVLGPQWRERAASGVAHAIGVAYPVSDLVLAVVALVLVQWAGTPERRALRTVAAGLLVMAVSDVAFSWLTTDGTYSSANPISLLWPVAYLLITFAATQPAEPAEAASVPHEPTASLVIPYATLLAAAAIGLPRAATGGSLGPFLTVNVAVLIALVLIRQALTTLDLRRTVHALHDRELALQRLAHHDPLTGLPNRGQFVARLEALVAERRPVEPAVVYLDLDGFKEVNDRFGHAVGDDVLVDVSGRLRACLGPDMLLARLGGDEFVVLVEAGYDVAVGLARDLVRVFSVPFHVHGERLAFCASLGIATAPAGSGPDEAVRRADAAMYAAKASGGGRAVAYPDDHLLDVASDA